MVVSKAFDFQCMLRKIHTRIYYENICNDMFCRSPFFRNRFANFMHNIKEMSEVDKYVFKLEIDINRELVS